MASARRACLKLLQRRRFFAASPLPPSCRTSIAQTSPSPSPLPPPLRPATLCGSHHTSLLAAGICKLTLRRYSPSPASRQGGESERRKASRTKVVAVKPESGNANGESDDDGDEDDDENQDEDGVDMDGDEDGEEEDSVLLSETQRSLPDFKDPVEEAAYIGYRIDGRLKAGDFGEFKPPKAFAVVQVGSHQFKISPGDCIYTEKLKFADVNDRLVLEKVLLLGSKNQTIIGRPYVPKAFVHAAVEEQVLDAKVIIFKKKRRKNYRRTRGHRQELTRLRILDIRGLGESWSAAA